MAAGAMTGNEFGRSDKEFQNIEVQDAGGVNLVVGALEVPDNSAAENMVVARVEGFGDVGVAPSDIICDLEYR